MKAQLGLICLLLAGAACNGDKALEGKTEAVVAEATAAATAAPSIQGATTFSFSNENSSINYVGAKITKSHDGGFGSFEGKVQIPEGKLEQGVVSVTIKTDSITSDTEQLTKHLKSPELLDTTKFPTASFVSTSVAPGSEGTHTLTGNFSLHGVTKAISFPAKIEATDDAVKVEAEFKFNRKDFGIVYPGMPDDLIKDDVVIKLKIDAKKQG